MKAVQAHPQQRLQGLIVGSRRYPEGPSPQHRRRPWSPEIDRSFPLEAIADAFQLQESGSHFGKIVIEF